MGARLIVVTGGKGGPGATTLAVGLAGALAADGRGVLLADLDPAGGDVAAHLPAEPHRGLLPLLSLTGGSVGAHLWVLPGLPRPDPPNGGLLSPVRARAVVLAACQLPEIEVAVVDAGRPLPGSVGASLLEVAELGVLAVRPDYLGALAARRAMDAAPRARRLVPVAVGVRRRWLGDVAELEQVLGHRLAGTVPARARAARRAVEAGAATARGRLGRAYTRLARSLLTTLSADDAPLNAAPLAPSVATAGNGSGPSRPFQVDGRWDR